MKRLLSPEPAVADVALLIGRVIVGVVLIAHGGQKLFTNGLDGTEQAFDAMGIPAPALAALFAAGVEFVGGILLILGLLTPVVAVLVAVDMAGAFWFAHRESGIFVTEGGWELVGMIFAAAILFIGLGAGRLSADGVLTRGRR